MPDLWSASKKCNRWLKSFAGSWNRIGANAFLSVYSMGSPSLTAYMSITCIFMSQPCKFNAMCHGTSSSTLNILLRLSWNLIKEEVGANKNTQILLDYGCVAWKQYRFLKQKPTTAIQHIGLHLWYTIKLRMAYSNKYMANMVSVGFIFIYIRRD